MCGIAGIISPHEGFVQHHQLQTMADMLQHRGPDGEGFWMNEISTVGFAHRRLAVMDLSDRARQPMQYGNCQVIFNGEIYNYVALRHLLQQQGYAFTTNTDTEIIPAAYDYWGKDCLHRFDGMFAFALWNEKEQQLWIARDRFGEKPLYYVASYNQRARFEQVYFASEMKALFAAGVPRNLNGSMLLYYLGLGHVQHPHKKTETFYTNILSLPPGCQLVIDLPKRSIQMRKWYKPQLHLAEESNEKVLIGRFKDLFLKSVENRLHSDVPCGTSLSGGLDSSSVLAAIDAVKQQGLLGTHWTNKAFTAGFPGFEKDETAFAASVAAHFRVQHCILYPQADDLVKQWQQFMYCQEEPVQSSSVFVQYRLCQFTRQQGVTVLLDGQGADEILAGYTRYTPWYLQQLLKNNFQHFTKEKRLLAQNGFLQHWNPLYMLAAYLPVTTAAFLQRRAQREVTGNAMLHPDFVARHANADRLHKPVIRQLDDSLYYDTFQFGLETLLRYADRNAMAHAVEIRLPFLNHDLVELAFSLPASFKIRNGYTKWILRESMRPYLPYNINWRKGKIGYEPPQQQWMQQPKMTELIQESKRRLVRENILHKNILQRPANPQAAHEKGNLDWRCLSAAHLFA